MRLRIANDGKLSLSDAANTLAAAILLILVVLAPISWGAVLPPGKFMIEAFAFSAAAVAFASARRSEGLRASAVPALAIIAVVIIGIVQILPLSASVVRSLSPNSARIYSEANDVLHLYDRPSIEPRISIAPGETRSTILLTLAYVALFAATATLARSRPLRRALATALILSALIHIAYAIATEGVTGRLHGRFVNANHFAGYLLIAFAFAFGTIWREVLTGSDRSKSIMDMGDRLERRVVPFFWRISVWVALATGIVLTKSRGGLAAALAATVFLLVVGGARLRTKKRLTLVAAVLSAGAIATVAVLDRDLLTRFLSSGASEATFSVRRKIWASSLEAWKLFPHFGDGLGAFKEAYRRVQPADVTGLVEQAHNDFLQLLVTGGWIGALFGVIAFVSLYVILFRGWLRQTHREESAFILSGLGALFALTIHGLVEFNMSIPATPATLAVMLGASVAAAQYRTER